MTIRAGFIGLGNIGAPMAERVARRGLPLVVWNRSAEKLAPLVALGAAVASSPADVAARCDVVCLCVDSAAAVEAIILGPGGVTEAAMRPRLIVDHSTIHPQKTRDLAALVKDKSGIAWLDAPVSGGPVGALAGTLAVMAGGNPADLDLARPILECFADRVTLMGPVGAGQATKACNQIINFGTIASIAEALAFGQRFGLDIASLPRALSGGFADSNMLREYGRASEAGENDNITLLINGLVDLFGGRVDSAMAGRLDILMKDLAIITDVARQSGSPAMVTSLVDSLFRLIQFQTKETGNP
ncbi:NAD(P)-dependent oxidoreductase [Sphingopyxis sp. GW247-27LB]|uniref:NAD(P)-dependent oxidoreductase n=1 Tax=Sphingopyxis sp. GW247-27LB TaxID=2012632 RepID=UPI000BA59ACF|nr:NAD(P)-dependent oxidoreductase [Sphingopyxis sp. GW247-27LB]PAL24199.1 2-hydroxy-3-oxopropionate reductase [Sphingopyxis sp. GW247-27LB]